MSNWPRALPSYLIVLTTWFCCVAATAQPMGSTVVVPFASPGQPLPLTPARQIEGALQQRHISVVSLHDAQDRFLARSRPPRTPTASDLDSLAKEAQAAIEHVAFGRTAAAERSVRQIVELADRSLETLNRETATARSLLDACLAIVRAALHDNKRDEALDQAMHCRRLVPDLAPSDVAHPANVVGALAEADDQLRRMRVGRLSVSASASQERNCEVFLNGRHLGHTPFTLDRAPTGDYRVQVECAGAAPARVHAVHLGDDPVELTVDTDFDAAIEAGPRIALRYASEEQARGVLVRHAALLGREMRADDVVLIGRIHGAMVLLRVQVRYQRLVAGATLDEDKKAATRAAEALAQARFVAFDPSEYRGLVADPGAVAEASSVLKQPSASAAALSPRAAAAASTKPPGAAPPSRDKHASARQRSLVIAGSVLTATGVAGLGAGFGLFLHSRELRKDAEAGEPGSPDQIKQQQKYEDFRLVPLVGIAGSALATAGIPMLLPSHGPRSAAAWAAGALAGAAGIAAIAFGAAKTPSEPVLGGLLLATGAPLLSIPITQLVRAGR
jgi:hypothetical protein